MHIILTHEQADFDAIGSLLGASLIFEAALPVLPRRLNHNVKAFLALCSDDFQFIDHRDLPIEPIDRITLVDTQSLISMKGVSSSTQIGVIDHHPLREGIPQEWNVKILDLGATTTMLVEALQDEGELLSTFQATLLLLGIYEDTGSLTYSRTTSRDLRAAAFLIEQGANLRVANDFLNHPLSPSQQGLYDALRNSAKFLTIHGHNVVIACGEAQEIDEELATVAHKMRDLLDPDAIFVLIVTRGGVQMIARSTSDNIDVGMITAQFGGGGHERAAACLIRGKSINSVCAELEAALPKYVKPAISVAQIMSKSPQVLAPDASVEEAATRMRRYGYEGYPIVKSGQVIGLLTRRAVDRAVSHNLKLPVSSLMEAGSHSVAPSDSIDVLQKLISETGWGQIPVVDPQSREIIGIVTRTDLLKNLSPIPKPPGSMNLSDKLAVTLPADRLKLIHAIAEIAYEQHAALYIVGGFVRDLLLARPSLDFDLVVEGDALALARSLVQKYGGRFTGHTRFGTAKWHLRDTKQVSKDKQMLDKDLQTIDLVSARTEFYTHPSALPIVESGSIKLDLHRRDFTINTLALRLDGKHYGELYDYWGGLADLHNGYVRVLHSLSFVDDPTRILRAVRFEQRFSFQIEARTTQLIEEAKSLLERISGDRIRHEFNHILTSEKTTQILSRLQSLGLLEIIHPAIIWDDWLCLLFQELKDIQAQPIWELGENLELFKRNLAYMLWFIRLPDSEAALVIKRLKLPISLERMILAASQLWRDRKTLLSNNPGKIVSRLDNIPVLACYAVYLAEPDQEIRGNIQKYVSKWRFIQPQIDGNYLRSLNIPPGPVYRQILSELKNAWLEGIILDRMQEQEYLSTIIDNLGLAKLRKNHQENKYD